VTFPNQVPPSIRVDVDADGSDATFEEYKFVAEDTAKLTDRRQTVNNLFITLNVLFITGGGYLLSQVLTGAKQDTSLFWYVGGMGAIAIIATLLNDTWLRLTDYSRRLINLRFRYLEALETRLRGMKDTFFTDVDTPLKGTDPKLRDSELPPPNYPGAVITVNDKRWVRTRGTYTVEEVLYGNPKSPMSFSALEKRVTWTFIIAYWASFLLTLSWSIAVNWTALGLP
jgi:hypothetical protein